jgi:hypothetical protein
MQKADEYLKSELKRFTDEATRISRGAEDENRKMTDDEVKKIEELVDKAKDIRGQLGEWERQESIREAIQRAGDINEAPPTLQQEDAKTVGDAFVRSPGYKALKDRGFAGGTWSSGPVLIDGSKVINSPETGTPRVEALDLASGLLPLSPQVIGGGGLIDSLPLQAPTVADLFAQGTATSNTLVYLEETAETPGVLSAPYLTSSAANVNAVLTSEGTAKPAAFVDFTKRTVALDKLAAFLPVSEELLEDEPAIVAYINTRLALFVRQAEDKRILARLITASSGNTAGFTELGGNNVFDSIMAGITMVRVEGGLEPDAVIMNPIDFAKMMVAKASTAGSYFNGGPYGAIAQGPWGLRTVVTGAVAAGSPIVGAFREGGQVWRKGGLSVEASNSHNDYFRYNLVALRAEERVGLAVYRPRAFQTLFLTS